MTSCYCSTYFEDLLVWLVATVLMYMTAINLCNTLAVRPSLDERQPRPEEEIPVNGEAVGASLNSDTTGEPSYTEFQGTLGPTDFGGDVVELDDLDTEIPESSTSSPPSPSEYRGGQAKPRTRSNSLGRRTRSNSRARRGSEDRVPSRASPLEYLQPQQSQVSLFGTRRRQRPNDTESRGSEVYRLEPYDPYYRRRAASVPALRSGIEDR